ncbi:hypothetical protein H5410_053074 [Solanum commersonii]|uniref:R13L1/DRL21-like LRR repeat region domain-containing protein n=1 Tax=Solanum commersonii TaxID=4109 RepID=A0A9J5X3X9_SOLCO|nr:hypothetical protein H5410_053074 [Solanum commersonii]
MLCPLLLQYSWLQDVELDEHNNIRCCKMHDLVHDLAGDILKSKLFDQKSVGGENLSQVRYFGWNSPSDQIDMINERGHICILFSRNNISKDALLSFQFLRVLNLSSNDFRSDSRKWCFGNQHFRMPVNMGQLTCLQTLQIFKVGLEKGCRIEELGCLNNLRGELMIRGLQLVYNREEVKTEVNDEYVLDGLQPHPNLKKLVVVNYLRTRFPSWFSEELLPNLVELKLSGCRKCKEIPSLGQLKLLRHLELIGFH